MDRTLTLALLCCTVLLRAQTPVSVELVPFATGLQGITDIAHCGDDRLFVTLRSGSIRIVRPDGSVLPEPFLQIPVNSAGGEQGLLGLCFDPDYTDNGWFYVHYSTGSGAGSSRISRFSVSPDPDVALAGSEEVLLVVPQTATNHNGGDLDFGPDGYLYIATGDGGGAGDTPNNAQNLNNLLGNILRIDVHSAQPYAIPADNPFVDQPGILPEIWASGLRNPWRMGFDRLTGDLWLGDVGQSAWEEIDFWPAGDNSGPNFGWRCYEGFAPFNTNNCEAVDVYVPPVQVHGNIPGGWCSIIGGRVYRGTQYERFYGRYIYTDHCKGEFHSLRPDGQGGWTNENLLVSGMASWSCIGENVSGELFAGRLNQGILYRVVDPCPMAAPQITQQGSTLFASGEGVGFTWYLNGVVIPGGTGSSIELAGPGEYSVLATYAGGCELLSEALFVTSTGVPAMDDQGVRVWPVPTRDRLTVEGLSANTRVLRVLDTTGREVRAEAPRADQGPWVMDLSAVPAGSYLLEATDDTGNAVLRRWVSVVR